MKLRRALLLVACIWAMPLSAPAPDDDPIPPPLRPLLARIKPGMNRDQVRYILLQSYPKLRQGSEMWSGQSGCFGFSLDHRYSVMFSGIIAEREDLLCPRSPQKTIRDLEKSFLFQSNLKMTLQPETWSGQVGCFGFHLDSRYLVALSDGGPEYEEVIAAGPDISIFDNLETIRYDLHPTGAGHYEIKHF